MQRLNLKVADLAFGTALLLAAAVPRVLFARNWRVTFDGDEALVGVQALDLLRGQVFLYFPGQDYLGTLQAAVAAPLIALFGNEPWALRVSPALWIIPGLLALILLEQQGSGPLASRRGQWLLAVQWLFPPAVMFISGIKAWGGHLEGLVLGLWSMVFIWPRLQRSPGVPKIRLLVGGVLLGLGVWTDDLVLLFAPALILLFSAGLVRGAIRLACVVLGFLIGYLPIWVPRIASFQIGPPGLEGTEWKPDFAMVAEIDGWRIIPNALSAALTTRPNPDHADVAYLSVVLAGVVLMVIGLSRDLRTAASWHERIRTLLWSSPSLTVTAILAISNLGALMVSPEHLNDGEWWRYTLYVTPFLIVAPAYGLVRLPPPASFPSSRA